MIPQIHLRRGKEESLLRRHPWIFSGAIESVRYDGNEIPEGALVDVYTRSGDFIARGHYQIGSIAVRVLSFCRETIDQEWWNRRIAVAHDVRRTLGLTDNPDTNCYRLVHGEGDALPGLVVDIYGTAAVVQCHSVGMYHARMEIAAAVSFAHVANGFERIECIHIHRCALGEADLVGEGEKVCHKQCLLTMKFISA